MLFGQSIFQSVLERLAEEAEELEPDAAAPGAYKLRGFGAAFIAEKAEPSKAAFEQHAAAYQEMAEGGPPPPQPKPECQETEPRMPPHLERLSVVEILEDLQLSQSDTPAQLSEKRRTFARNNHPDRLAPQFREQATSRMKIANLLIDEAMSRAR